MDAIEHVFRWDLDKTYLLTEFDRVRDLVRTAFQKPEEKRNVPGAVPLLRALLRPTPEGDRRAVYFISGSPRQMRKTLTRKFELDGIEPEAFVLKPNLENLLKFRFRAIRGQVGYKLRALLEHQVESPQPVPETLFGDDAEQDAVIYSIYAEISAGRIRGDDLRKLLDIAQVYPHNTQAILEAAERLEPFDRVHRIFIILDRKSPPSRFRPYKPRLVPVYNYFQASLVLHQDGLLDPGAVAEISLDMIERDNYTPFALANSFQDLLRRGHLETESLGRVAEAVLEHQPTQHVARQVMSEFAERLGDVEDSLRDFIAPTFDERPDYAQLLGEELAARKHHKSLRKKKARARKKKRGLF